MKLDEVLAAKGLVVIDFYSSTCPPCKLVEQELRKVKSELESDIAIFQVDQQKHPDVFSAFNVNQVPYVKVFRSGRPIWSRSGLFTKDEMISEILKQNEYGKF
jgi:thioredoxin 1